VGWGIILRHVFINVAVAALLALIATGADAKSFYTLYDVNMFLNEPHPLANQMGTRWQPVQPAGAPIMPQRRIDQGASPAPAPVFGTTAAAQLQPATTGTQQPAAAGADGRTGGILSEIRIGVLVHDKGPFSRREEVSNDVNFEFLFASPKFLEIIGAPRPHVGVNINTGGDTNQMYMGLGYELEFWGSWFTGFSLGGAVHDGTKSYGIGAGISKELGCRFLFRGSVEFGYRFRGRHSLSAMLDHISNINICDKNEGLENVGIRYGYRF
jgi:lipid A 3-O-deacylase